MTNITTNSPYETLRRQLVDAFKVKFHENPGRVGYDYAVFEGLLAAFRIKDTADVDVGVLSDIRKAIINADPQVLTCTLWMPEEIIMGATVVDYIDMAMMKAMSSRSAEAGKPVGYIEPRAIKTLEAGGCGLFLMTSMPDRGLSSECTSPIYIRHQTAGINLDSILEEAIRRMNQPKILGFDPEGMTIDNPEYLQSGDTQVGVEFVIERLRGTQDSPSALSTPADIEPVAWLHPTANWSHVDYDRVRMHCGNDGPMPVPLYAAPVADIEPVSVPEVEALAETLCETFAAADPGDDGTGKAWPYAREWEKASWRAVAKAALFAAAPQPNPSAVDASTLEDGQ